jgi:hypothetical protein
VGFQGIETRAPEGTEFLRPGVDFLERLDPELIEPVAAFATLGDESGVLQDFQVLGDRGKRNPKGPRKVGGGAFAGLERLKHPPSRRVRDGVEDVVVL